jgi:Putative peptidoglycan binding domain/Trypsin-like peptidase domain
MRNVKINQGADGGVFRFLAILAVAIGLLMPLVPARALSPPKSGLETANPLVSRVAVFGKDDRTVLPARLKSLEGSVGLLYDQTTRTVCSAFCVGDDVVATAGHCLFGTDHERGPKLASFTFRLPAKKQSSVTPIAGTRADGVSQYVTSGSIELSTRPPIDASHDWALVRIAKPMCRGNALPLSRAPSAEVMKLAAKKRVYEVGFHRDFGNWTLAYGAPCSIRRSFDTADKDAIAKDFADARNVLFHTCDTGGASSGSPLLIDGENGPEVVGINVGTYVQSQVLLEDGQVVHRYKASAVANTGVAAEAIRDKLEAFERADILATREDLRRLQIRLAQYGHYSGPRDGAYGPRLRSAIESFERAQQAQETGLATAELLNRLTELAARDTAKAGARAGAQIESGSLGSHQVTRGRAP